MGILRGKEQTKGWGFQLSILPYKQALRADWDLIRMIQPESSLLSLPAALMSLSLLISCQAPAPPTSLFQPVEMKAGEDSQMGGTRVEGELSYQPTLDGQWVHYSQISTCVDLGSSLEQLNRSLYRVSVEQRPNGGLIETWEACEIDLTPVISIKAQVPEALRRSVYPLETRQGQAVGASTALQYTSGPMIELWGVNFIDPLLDDLPIDEMDERIYDMDEDGEAGATLLIGTACEAHMIQRRVSRYLGVLEAPDLIAGDALSTTEQFIISATSPICRTAYQTRSHPARSQFIRLRIDGAGGALNLDEDGDGDVSCSEIINQRAALIQKGMTIQEVDDASCRL